MKNTTRARAIHAAALAAFSLLLGACDGARVGSDNASAAALVPTQPTTDAGSSDAGSLDGGVSSMHTPASRACNLPVGAFLDDWRAGAPLTADAELALGRISPRLFKLLDQLDTGTVPHAFFSLRGLSFSDQRMTIAAAAIQLSRSWPTVSLNGHLDAADTDYSGVSRPAPVRTASFIVDCAEVRRLALGSPKSALEVARAVNLAARSPVQPAAIAARFADNELAWEVSAANDFGEGRVARQLATTSSTAIANPVKQLFAGFVGAINASHGTPRRKVWLAVPGSQAGLDALLRALGDSTPPPPPSLARVPGPTASNPILFSGVAEAHAAVYISGGINPASAVANARGDFQVSVVLKPNAANQLSAHVVDAAGNASPTVTLELVHDNLPPVVTISAPTNLSVLTRSPASVRPVVSDASAIVSATVNRVLARKTNGAWEAEVPLPLGDSYLIATATDAAGNVGTGSTAVTHVAAEAANFLRAAQGGTVSVTKGPLAGSYITIPPGAMPNDSMVALTLPNGAVPELDVGAAVGLAVKLEPSGVVFKGPVRVGIRYSPSLVSLIREKASGVELFHLTPGGAKAVPSTIDHGKGLVMASLNHFSLYQAGSRCSGCLKAEVVAGNPTSLDQGDGAAASLRMDPWWLEPMATGPLVMLDTALTGAGARIRRLDGTQVTTVAGVLAGGSTQDGVLALDAELQNSYVVAQDKTDGTPGGVRVPEPSEIPK